MRPGMTDPDETGDKDVSGNEPIKPKNETFFQTLLKAVRLNLSPIREEMPHRVAAVPVEPPLREIRFHPPDVPYVVPASETPNSNTPATNSLAGPATAAEVLRTYEAKSTFPQWPEETAFDWATAAEQIAVSLGSYAVHSDFSAPVAAPIAGFSFGKTAQLAVKAATTPVTTPAGDTPAETDTFMTDHTDLPTDGKMEEQNPAPVNAEDLPTASAATKATGQPFTGEPVWNGSGAEIAPEETAPITLENAEVQSVPAQPEPAMETENIPVDAMYPTQGSTAETSEASQAEAPRQNPESAAVEPEETSASVSAAPPYTEDAGVSASISSDPADLAASDDIAAIVENVPELTDNGEEAPEEEDVDFNELRSTLIALQQQIRAANIPVVIVFEGWDAAGKGTMLSKLLEGLDPRGYQVYPIAQPTPDDECYPLMRRYWVNTPTQGNISIFCGSWYREVSNACFENKAARRRLAEAYREIINLESSLVCDGVLLIKFFLHISRKEQKERLKALESKKSTRWRVQKEDWEQNERYGEYLRLYDAMIARTHYEGMLWHVLRSDNRRACVKQIYDVVINAFHTALEDRAESKRVWDTPFLPHLEGITTRTMPQLDAIDPEQALTEPYKPAVDKAQKRLRKLQNDLYRKDIPMVICFEGWDAAGKGGVIRRLSSALDPRGFDVVPISAPTPLEKSHHYLWRFWNAVPPNGHIAVFDRTWYGRVLVERIEGYCTPAQWKRAYEEINRFEAELVAHGVILCKFWLQIDNATQLLRFEERENSENKLWKITEEDWRNREKWPQYETAVNDMLQKTNTAAAPWTVIEANNKQYARLKVLQTVIQAMEERLEGDVD